MSNEVPPTIHEGAHGDLVKRLQRSLRRAGDLSVDVDGAFGPATKAAVIGFQKASDLQVDGVVGPATWASLPDGSSMPTLRKGSKGEVVASLQTVLTNGAPEWDSDPGGIDGEFGPGTHAAVEAFQRFGHVKADGVVGDPTWQVAVGAMGATLESEVGLEFAEA